MTTGVEASVFPVVASVVDPDHVCAEIEQGYDIGEVRACRLIECGVNDTYVLSTSQARYAVRIYRAGGSSRSAIEFELNLLSHLRAKDVPVSAPVHTRDGGDLRQLMAPEGPRLLVLFTYAHGRSIPWDQTRADRAGRLLADIHQAAVDFKSPHTRTPYDLEHLIEKPLVALAPFLSHRREDWTFLQQFAARLWSYAAPLISAGLEWGTCHGDFDAHNVHISEHGCLTVFDFDFCGPGWLAFDLVVPKWGFISVHTPELWEAFLRGYLERHALHENNLAAIPLFQALRHLWGMGLRARSVGRQGTQSLSEGYLSYRIRSFKAWEAEYVGRT